MLEPVAVVFGIVSVWLSVRQNIWSWPTAIVNVALYFVIFYQSKLYAGMGLQLFYLGISVYGWYHWLFGGEHRTVLRVSRTPRALAAALPVLWVAVFVGLGRVLDQATDSPVPYIDAALSAGSLIAQWMMTRKYLGSWLLWVALDVGYVALFLHQRLYLTAFLYGVFLFLAARGFVEWRASWRAERAAATSASPA